MNSQTKTIMSLGVGLLFIAPQIVAANGNVSQLDQEGINIILELTKAYDDFVNEIAKPDFNFSQWDFLLKTNIKTYVENYSKATGVPDRDLMRTLNLLLQTNDTLMQHIKNLQNYKLPNKALNDPEILSLKQELIKPFLQIKENVTTHIIPELEKQSYYLSADKKNKAREILIRSFNLINQMARIMTLYISSRIVITLGAHD